MAVIWLVQDRDVRATALRDRAPPARVVDHLGTDRAGRQEATDEAASLVEPVLGRPVLPGAEPGTTPVADVVGDHDLAIVQADDTLAAGSSIRIVDTNAF